MVEHQNFVSALILQCTIINLHISDLSITCNLLIHFSNYEIYHNLSNQDDQRLGSYGIVSVHLTLILQMATRCFILSIKILVQQKIVLLLCQLALLRYAPAVHFTLASSP